MPGAPEIFDSRLLIERRDRFAPGAQMHDFLLHRVGKDFAERLAIVQRSFPLAANVGAYHGVLSEIVRQQDNVGSVVDLEPAMGLLRQAKGAKVQSSLDALPLAPQSLDLVVSGLSWHFVNDLPGLLAQVRRALKPDGLLLAALLGGATLQELRTAWLVAEEELSGGASPRVAPFADVRELGGLLQRAGFALPVADSDVCTVTYETPLALMRELQQMAAANPLLERRRVPVTRRLLLRAAAIYAERYARADGRVPATFEIVTLTAWAPDPSQPRPLPPGSAKMRLADALRVAERSAGEPAGPPHVRPENRGAKE